MILLKDSYNLNILLDNTLINSSASALFFKLQVYLNNSKNKRGNRERGTGKQANI